MKRTRKIMTALSAFAVALSACTDLRTDIVSPEQDGMPLSIRVKASDGIQTRGIITGTSLQAGSVIGLTLCDISGQTYQGTTYENISYKASGSSSGQTWSSDSPLMVSNTPGTVYAYYPYSEEVTSLQDIPVEATSSVQTDWMYGTPVTGLTKDKPEADIVLNHALSAVRLSVRRGTYSGTGVVGGASVRSDAIATAASLDARTGKLSSFSGKGTAVAASDVGFTLSANARDTDIIVIPASGAGDLEVFLTVDGKELTTTIPDVTLEQGRITCCEISVNDGEVYITNVAVQAWIQSSAGSHIVQNSYKVTIAGDTDGLSFSNSIDDQGNVTIVAVPYISDDAETRPVTIAGDATLSQSVDEDTGILTVSLSDIESDVTVLFEGFYLWLTFTYEVTDISSETKIYNATQMDEMQRIKVDGVDVPVKNKYQFSTTGTHTVKMALDNNTRTPGSFFYSVPTLTSAKIPEGVEIIGYWGFLGCSKLTEVSLPSTLQGIEYQAFQRTGLTSVTIPEGCGMSYGVFDTCYKMTEVKLPSTLTYISDNVFSGCSSLTELEIPSGVTKIGREAFKTSGLISIDFPDAISVLDEGVCMQCRQLKEINFPANLTEIAKEALCGCTALERVTLSDGTVCTEEVIIPEGVTSIGARGIMTDSPYIKRMRLPSTLNELEPKSLANCILEEYTMTQQNPKYDIRNGAVIETATNTLVGAGVLAGNIHESVTAIGEYAFYSSEVETVDLHAGITEIQDYAFDYAKPKVIISRATTPPTLGEIPFRIAQYDGTLKVPEEAKPAYRTFWMINEIGYLGWSTASWALVSIGDGE